MSDRVASRTSAAIPLAACLAFLALVVTSPHHVLYDEPFFVKYIPLLHEYGFTLKFMNSLTGTVGPLYAFVHAAFEPVTHLQPVGMRFVNVIGLVVVAGIVAAWLKHRKRPDYWVAGCAVLVVPMTWVVAGMALTEMPAMVFVALSLYLELMGLEALNEGRPVLGWFVSSGVCLGIAVWGRQPYVLLAAVPVVLALQDRRLRAAAVTLVAIVGAFSLPLVIIWRGLVPPSHYSVQQGLSITHGITSLAYTGICFVLLAPQAEWISWKLAAGLAALTTAVNAVFGVLEIYPLRSAVQHLLPVSLEPAWGGFCGSVFLSWGVIFLAMLVRITWKRRQDLSLLACNLGLLCVAVSPIFIAHQYSSRYTAMSLPYLLLAAYPWRRWGLVTVLATTLGCGLGFLSLYGYFSS